MEGLITFSRKNDWEKAIIPMKAQDISNTHSNSEPSKQWKHHSTQYQTLLQRAPTRTGKYSNRLKQDANTKNKPRHLQSDDPPPSKEQKALEKRMPLQLLLPPLKKSSNISHCVLRQQLKRNQRLKHKALN